MQKYIIFLGNTLDIYVGLCYTVSKIRKEKQNDGVDFHSPLSVHSEMLIIVGNKRYVFINSPDTNNGIFINEDGHIRVVDMTDKCQVGDVVECVVTPDDNWQYITIFDIDIDDIAVTFTISEMK